MNLSHTEFVAETFVEEFLPYVHTGYKGVNYQKGILARDYISDSINEALGQSLMKSSYMKPYFPAESKAILATDALLQQ